MINQLKVERFKAARFLLFYIIAILVFAGGFLVAYFLIPKELGIESVFSQTICDTSLLFLICLVTARFLNNDFSNRTIHNEIKIGYRRSSVLVVRLLAGSLMAVLLHGIYVISALLGYAAKHGMDGNIFQKQNLFWILTIMLQLVALQSITTFIIFIFKSLSAAVCVSFIACNIIRNFTDSEIFTLSCFCLARNSETRTLLISSIYAVAITIVVAVSTHILFKKAEIK